MKAIPHPSITGLASGAMIATYLNYGDTPQNSVIGAISTGHYETAAKRLSNYSVALVGSNKGRKVLVGAVAVAIAGAFVRKTIPNVKLGGKKLYATI